MEEKVEKYRRLPGNVWTRRSFFSISPVRSSLWLSDDHLLYVTSTSWSESYKRFYLKDIQAIVISRNASRRNINLLVGAGAVILGIIILSILIYAPSAAPAAIFFGIQVAFLMLYILLNTLLGPTCLCRLNTAVQAEDLNCLGRIRTAKKATGILKSVIEAAQKDLAPEVSVEAGGEQSVLRASAHALVEAKPAPPAREARHVDGKVHAALFGLMLAGATSSVIELFYQGRGKNLVDMLLFLGIILMIIVALRRQSNSDLPGPLKTITWVALGSMAANFVFGFCFGIYYVISHIAEITPAADLRFEGPVFEGYCITVAVIEGAVGLAGLALLSRNRLKIFSVNLPSDAAAQKES